jgi:sec-independent protein translocase protein TatA
MFGLDVPSHWIILAFLTLVFFGYKKLPDMTRSFGRSLRIFKSEMTAIADDPAPTSPSATPASAPHLVPVSGKPTTEPTTAR